MILNILGDSLSKLFGNVEAIRAVESHTIKTPEPKELPV